MATDQPFQELKSIVTFIMSVYAPMWFAQKVISCFKDEVKRIVQFISTSMYSSTDLKVIVDPVMQSNSFFAHPKKILIALITGMTENMYVSLGCEGF